MSSYIDNNLMPNETITIRGRIHWYTYVSGGIFFLLGALSMFASSSGLGFVFLIVGIVLLIRSFLFHISTELAVTSNRVIAKFGFIRRNTIELNHQKVESFNVEQSIAGRIFNFGTISINGTGGITTPIPVISNPLEFRKIALATIESE